MELRELKVFVTLAQEGNFRRAAERLNITQPPLTRSIQKLEHSLGVALFTRTTRTVALTTAGERLLARALPLLEQADATARYIRHQVADRSRKFTIGSTALAFITVLPAALQEFRAAYPQTEVEVSEMPTDTLVSRLLSAEIDLAYLLLPQAHPAMTVRSLFKERMRLAVAGNHPLAKQGKAPLSAFAGERFIMHLRKDAPAMYDEILRCCAVAGFRPRTIEKAWNHTCTGLVAAGMGVHFIAGKSACLNAGDIALVTIEDPAPVLELGIAWRKDDHSEHLAHFLKRPGE